MYKYICKYILFYMKESFISNVLLNILLLKHGGDFYFKYLNLF